MSRPHLIGLGFAGKVSVGLPGDPGCVACGQVASIENAPADSAIIIDPAGRYWCPTCAGLALVHQSRGQVAGCPPPGAFQMAIDHQGPDDGEEIDSIMVTAAELERLRAKDVAAGSPRCKECGCTNTYGCGEGCSWAAADLCTSCAPRVMQ